MTTRMTLFLVLVAPSCRVCSSMGPSSRAGLARSRWRRTSSLGSRRRTSELLDMCTSRWPPRETCCLAGGFRALRRPHLLAQEALALVSHGRAGPVIFRRSCGGGGPPRPSDLGESKLDLGEPGIAWYTTWESAASEAKRSGRPIMFVAAATQCHGISGVF